MPARCLMASVPSFWFLILCVKVAESSINVMFEFPGVLFEGCNRSYRTGQKSMKQETPGDPGSVQTNEISM